MPNHSVSFIAKYAEGVYDAHSVSLGCNPVCGGNAIGVGHYEPNATITIIAQPSAGYRFIGWYDENNQFVSADMIYTFTMQNSNVRFEAQFEAMES